VDCLNCHSWAVTGDGYVAPERCNFCHAKVEHLQRYGDRDFVHQKHVTEHKVDCEQCHTPIRHGKEVRLAQAKVAAHECAKCHGGADDAIEKVWFGTLPGIPKTPSRMAQVGQACPSCHVEPVHSDGHLPSRPSCEPCHPPEYNRLPDMWKTALPQALAELERIVKSRAPSADRDTLLEDIRLYRAGHPHHNPDLLSAIEHRAGVQVSGNKGRCAACHPAPRDLTPIHNGRPFPHRAHLDRGLDCLTCHETEAGKHGRLKLPDDQCNGCHHEHVEAKVANCVSCHKFQNQVYRGDTSVVDLGAPSAMSAADVSCTDCHSVKPGKVARPEAAACIGCHDQSYGDKLKQWQGSGTGMLATIEERLRMLPRDSKAYSDYQRLALALRRDGSKTVHNPELFSAWMKRIEAAN
jgi:hypothetical protein